MPKIEISERAAEAFRRFSETTDIELMIESYNVLFSELNRPKPASPDEIETRASAIDFGTVCAMNSVEDIIEECLLLKDGNQELMIYCWRNGFWTAEIGNPTMCVALGEAPGEVRVNGKSMRDAVLNLYEALANIKLGRTTPV